MGFVGNFGRCHARKWKGTDEQARLHPWLAGDTGRVPSVAVWSTAGHTFDDLSSVRKRFGFIGDLFGRTVLTFKDAGEMAAAGFGPEQLTGRNRAKEARYLSGSALPLTAREERNDKWLAHQELPDVCATEEEQAEGLLNLAASFGETIHHSEYLREELKRHGQTLEQLQPHRWPLELIPLNMLVRGSRNLAGHATVPMFGPAVFDEW